MRSEAQRTLVKSPPELWSELSDPAALARHLGELGEIRIVRTEPETTVEWEATGVEGSIELKPSGWGTKVTLTATREIPEVEAVEEPEPVLVEEPEPVMAEETATAPRLGFFARLFRRRSKQHTEPEPVVVEAVEIQEPELVEEPEPADIAAELTAAEELATEQTTAVLMAVLDRLGAAHHRPFSRA